MNHSLINSVVSMQGLQQKLDMISNNVSNMQTTGYKKQEASFIDILHTVQPQPAEFRQAGRISPPGLNQGWGMRLGAILTDTSQGSLSQTDLPLDLALDGSGMFEVLLYSADENGEPISQPGWTRDGSFMLSMNPEDEEMYYLTTKAGHFVRGMDDEPIQIPIHHQVKISASGVIMAYDELNPEAAPVYAGQLKLMRVLRPELLELTGGNLYRLPAQLVPYMEEMMRIVDETDRVEVRQGFLENSNVNLADELTNVMLAQRAFQLNSRAIQSADTMMNIANNLRGN